MKISETVKQFLMDARARNRAKGTLNNYTFNLRVLEDLLKSLCGVVELEEVKVMHLRICVQHLLDNGSGGITGNATMPYGKISSATTRGYVRVWKAFFHWCYEEELIDVDVVARLHAPASSKKIIATFTVEHIEKILKACNVDQPFGYRNYVIILLFLDTGMRLSELVGLDIDDVQDTYVKVFGKGRKEREIGISAEVSKVLWKYIHKYRLSTKTDDKALFISRLGARMTINAVKMMIYRIKKATGIVDVRVSPHTFRHTFSKFYLEQGGELFKLSRELGHSSIKITEVYLQDFTSKEARKDHNVYSPIKLINVNKKRKIKRGDSEGVEN